MSHRPWEISYKQAREFNLSKDQIKYLNKSNKTQYKNNAWHEAAHAVVGHRVGIATEFIDLTPRIEKIENGICQLTAAQTKQSEFVAFKAKAQEGDFGARAVITSHIVSQLAGVVFDLWNGQFGGGMDIAAAVQSAMHMFRGDTDECADLMRASAVLAGGILDANTAYLTALSGALFEEQMLTQPEIEAIVSKSLESEPLGLIEYSDMNFIFYIEKDLSPRYQIRLLDCEQAGDHMTITKDPPFDFFVRLDETMAAEMI